MSRLVRGMSVLRVMEQLDRELEFWGVMAGMESGLESLWRVERYARGRLAFLQRAKARIMRRSCSVAEGVLRVAGASRKRPPAS